jgi:SAM-dependent methyltransferase
VSHATQDEADAVREVFNSDYTLGTTESIFDMARAKNYASALVELCPATGPARVLEAGCGAGLVLKALSTTWTDSTFTGLEAAPLLAAQGCHGSRVSIRQQFLEDVPAEGPGFDLVFAINVLEHAANPRHFLQAAARQVSANGKVILICPNATEPNMELLFLDHRHSFTAVALSRFADESGLELVFQEDAQPRFEDFRIYVLVLRRPDATNRLTVRSNSPDEIHRRRSAYLLQWSRLDGRLLERTKEARRIVAFGAGEAAALLRAYAPQFWGKVEALVVDQPLLRENLDKRVMATQALRPTPGQTVVLATHPRSQARLAARLIDEGFDVVRWDQDIAR